MRQVDSGPDDHGVWLAAHDLGDQGLVNFQLVDRQPLQVGQCGVATAEVVDGKAHSQVGQAGDRLQHAGVGNLAFAQLHLEVAGGQGIGPQQPGYRLRQLRVLEVAHRQIDRDGQLQPGQMPHPALPQGGIQHPVGQRFDQAGALGQRNEFVGRKQAVLGMLPAHQGLHAHLLAAGDRHLGLVEQQQLVALQALAQAAHQRQPLIGIVRDAAGLVHAVAAARALGLVHGQVGQAQYAL